MYLPPATIPSDRIDCNRFLSGQPALSAKRIERLFRYKDEGANDLITPQTVALIKSILDKVSDLTEAQLRPFLQSLISSTPKLLVDSKKFLFQSNQCSKAILGGVESFPNYGAVCVKCNAHVCRACAATCHRNEPCELGHFLLSKKPCECSELTCRCRNSEIIALQGVLQPVNTHHTTPVIRTDGIVRFLFVSKHCPWNGEDVLEVKLCGDDESVNAYV